MKQETVNTFNEGMNKDLNPIVTPNNLLTDNLNGTFLTYNGDELSLQNDAGNTRIPVKDTGDSVKLSEGFYPLGMKEYGGVLYIVSGKKGVDEIGRPDPKFDEIEFGSYPSPELASYTTFNGEKTVVLNNKTDTLYKYYVINNDYFKTGRYIKFNVSSVPEFSYVWRPDNKKGLYNIKLLLQLDNGTIDLTDDVWLMFQDYKQQNPNDTANHWILSKDFIYHCPYSYKGKLVVQTVLSEPVFEVIQYYEIDIISGTYRFALDVKVENTEALQIVGSKLVIITDISQETSTNFSPNGNGVIEFRSDIDTSNKIMHYEITPIFKHTETTNNLDWGDLPFEFQDKYIIKGSILLEDKFFNLGFKRDMGECHDDKKYYRVLAMVDQSGYINTQLEKLPAESKPYVFAEHGFHTQLSDSYNLLGTYTTDPITNRVIGVNENQDLINTFENTNPGLWGVVRTKLLQMQTAMIDPSCSEAIITIEFSVPLAMASPYILTNETLTLYQDTSSELLTYESFDGKRFYVKVSLGSALILNFRSPSFGTIYRTVSKEELTHAVSNSTLLKIGLTVDFYKWTASSLLIGSNTQLIFYNNRIPSMLWELGDYVQSQFDTNLANRLRIIKKETQYSFEFLNEKIYFDKSTDFGTFSIQVKDPEYVEDRIKHYLYQITGGTKVNAGEYINIPAIDESNNTNYIKIGNDQLGYLLFKEHDDLRTVIVDINKLNNIWS